jgi:putative inorganic carbon (HCO3(-)) transporter
MLGTGLGHFLPLALYFVLLSAIGLALFGRPRVTLYILIPLLPLQTARARLAEFPLGANIFHLTILAALAGGYFFCKGARPKVPFNRILVIYLVFIYVSMWFGALMLGAPLPVSTESVAFNAWKDYMAMPALYLISALCIQESKHIKMMLLMVCVANILVDRGFLLDVLGRDLSNFDYAKRQAGPLGFAGVNGLAAFLTQISLFLLGYLAFEKRRSLRLLGYSLVALNIYCILYSFSRGAYVALAAGLVGLGFLKKRWILLVLAIFLVSWESIVPPAVYQRVTMTYGPDDKLEASAAERVALWKDATQLISSSPLLGTGYNTYAQLHRVGSFKDTHNLYLKILVETGIVGFVIVFILLLGVIRMAFQLFQSEDPIVERPFGLGMLLCMGGLLILNLFGDRWSYVEINGCVWALWGVLSRVVSFQQPLESSEQPRQLESQMLTETSVLGEA